MKTFRLFSLIWLCLLSVAGNALAQTAWRDLPPEERHQLRQQMREHWAREQGGDSVKGHAFRQELSPEENRRRWRDIPPEERHRLREQMREQRQRDEQAERSRERPVPPLPLR
jgi:hypothetical protein